MVKESKGLTTGTWQMHKKSQKRSNDTIEKKVNLRLEVHEKHRLKGQITRKSAQGWQNTSKKLKPTFDLIWPPLVVVVAAISFCTEVLMLVREQ